jgi:hypothetical protein
MVVFEKRSSSYLSKRVGDPVALLKYLMESYHELDVRQGTSVPSLSV